MQTVVELPEFQKRCEKWLTQEEVKNIIDYLACHPESGDIMQGTGGIRKLRWAINGKGKSGGLRVIHYYHNQTAPLFLLTLFGKGEKANLSKAERNDLAKLTKMIIKQYEGDKS